MHLQNPRARPAFAPPRCKSICSTFNIEPGSSTSTASHPCQETRKPHRINSLETHHCRGSCNFPVPCEQCPEYEGDWRRAAMIQEDTLLERSSTSRLPGTTGQGHIIKVGPGKEFMYEKTMNELFEALNDSEIEALDEFLLNRISADEDTEGKDEGIIDISTLDGFFTAIVSGPDLIPPSQWLPEVWGDFEPEWETEEAFETVLTLMIRHMNGIVANLTDHPDDFEPLYYEREAKGKTYLIVDEWCEGYLRGVALSADQWNDDEEEISSLLEPIYAFTSKTSWCGHGFEEHEIERLQNTIAHNVREIHAFWLARRSDQLTSPIPARHKETKPGRNDPCPCGSGKKYKKCCLH